MADRDRDLLVGDQIFEHDLRGFVFDHRTARIAVKLLHFFEFLDDDGAQLLFRSENGLVLSDAIAHFFQLVRDFVDRQFGQAMQLQFEDRVRLLGRERLIGVGSLGARPVVLMSIFLPPKKATKLSRASARLALPRMIAITLSR